jgi:glycosyltransferase involved in cell wall biosynthesis
MDSKNNPNYQPKRFAFVVPRFGPGCGGAETLVAEIAVRLKARGDDITILTTCAKDNRTWENAWPEGMTEEFGLKVYRYGVDARDLNIWIPHQINIHEGINPGLNAQLDWLEHSVNSSGLYQHIATRQEEYDALFFAPYLFGTTFWGSLINPDKSILIPCLHDENYSYLESMKAMFGLVRGCVFNARAEMELAERLFGKIRGGVVGMGFEVPQREAATPYLEAGTRYILYLGRKETGKNGHKLIDNFITAKEQGLIDSDIKLVFCGGGSFDDLLRPGVLSRGDIVDIGYLSEQDKHRLLSHAIALVQPSRNESFSIVLMEAWLAGVPVVVDALCPVTREHAIDAEGGLYYADPEEFGLVINKLASTPMLRQQLGESGREYVRSVYDWNRVLERFDTVVRDIQGIA